MGCPAGAAHKPPPNHRWMDDAACYGINNFLNLPEEGGWTDAQRLRKCRGHKVGEEVIEEPCPVINQCLEYALSLPLTDIAHRGLVFGGFTGQQIAQKIKELRRAKV